MKPFVFELDTPDDTNALKDIWRKHINTGLTYGARGVPSDEDDQGHWNKHLIGNGYITYSFIPFNAAKLPLFEKNYPELAYIWKRVQEKIGSDRGIIRMYINGYTYGTDGYPHIDDPWIGEMFGEENVTETVVVYLNEDWKPEWGGETVLFNDSHDDIELAVLPKFGRALVFKSNQLHAGRSPSRKCPKLRCILAIKTFPISIESMEIGVVYSHTYNIPHSGRTFFEHLYNTMLHLEKQKLDRHIVMAGLYHSVYGTEFYEFNNPALNRDFVRMIIGEKAEALVHEFCRLKNRYEVLVDNTENYDEDTLFALRHIERANLIDQVHQDQSLTLKIKTLESLLKI